MIAAWDAARRAAKVLLRDHGATRVVAFGSLVRGDWMPAHSDIDLAVEGVGDDDYLTAHGAALSAAGGPVDLVRIETAAPGLRRCIETEGRELG